MGRAASNARWTSHRDAPLHWENAEVVRARSVYGGSKPLNGEAIMRFRTTGLLLLGALTIAASADANSLGSCPDDGRRRQIADLPSGPRGSPAAVMPPGQGPQRRDRESASIDSAGALRAMGENQN
jgi:hypothetical protein